MSTEAIDQHDSVQWEKQQTAVPMEQRYVPLPEQPKMQPTEAMPLEHPVHLDPNQGASSSIPSVSTSEALGGPANNIIQNDLTPLMDSVKTEPDTDLVDFKVVLIDMDAVSPCKEEAGANPAEPKPSEELNPDTIQPVPGTVPKKPKLKQLKSKRVKYTESYLEETLNQVRNHTLTLYAASKLTSIPRTTLQYRLSSVFKNKGTRGPYAVLSKNEEMEIVTDIKNMVRRGFPITTRRIEYKVSNYLKAHPRKNPFKDNKPGKQWIKNFIKRNPDLNITKQLSVDATEQDIRNWFRNVLSYLEDNQLADILKDSSRILICNEAGFMLNPASKGIVVDKIHKKNVSFIETTTKDHNMTVMFTFLANGSFVPPDVVLPTKRLTHDMMQSFNSDWEIGKSDNGRLDARNFTMYVMKLLYPTLVKRGTKFPVLYFVDGINSDVAFEAAEMCKHYDIILIALYPNAAQIIQQADVAAYKSLQTAWTGVLRSWRSVHKWKRLTLNIFGPLLEEAMEKSLNESTITNGFTLSGIYPFDPNAIDFQEYSSIFAANPVFSNEGIASVANITDETSNITDDTDKMPCDSVGRMDIGDESNDRQIEIPESILKRALNMLGPSKINLYQTTPAEDLSHEDNILSYLYKNILILGESPAHDIIQDMPSTSKGFSIWQPTNLTPDDGTVSLEFDVKMDIKTENDSAESTEVIVGTCDYGRENVPNCDKTTAKISEEMLTSEKCQQSEINSNYAGEISNDAVHFATQHICSFPRITIHFCPVASKTKYHSFFLDSTGMYIAYLDACQKSSQEPVSSKVYNEIVLKERTKDPPLPSKCDDCQHVEKYDFGEISCAFLVK